MTQRLRLPRPLFAALLLTTVLEGAGASTTPAFIPRPSAVYEGFAAVNGPRAEVPVGALWIDGYGPHAEGAAADNLETVRGLAGITIDRDLELTLTAGLLDLLGIDPGLGKHFHAHFTDLSIVRVKDVDRLSGPPGERRIMEAMKAGSILVTSDSAIGLNLDKRSLGNLFAVALDSGSKRNLTIEGRDMFIAMRVATSTTLRSKPELFKLQEVGGELAGEASELLVRVKLSACAKQGGESCAEPFAWQLQKAGQA